MIPILYDQYDENLTTNGLGRLVDCIYCTVTEERNGIYECMFQYPVSGELFSEIQEGCIIGAIHDDAKDIQPFDIYAHSAPLDGVVTFFAHHVSYRLGNVILKPMSAGSCAAALAAIPNNTYNRCPFTFWTDKSVSSTWKNDVPSAVKAILGGQQGSILDVYGKGEYKWDKFNVRLYTNRGVDNGVAIRYGVNLTELTHEYDDSNSYNAVAPYWKSSEDDTVVTLANGIVITNNASAILVPWTTDTADEITDENGETICFDTIGQIKPVPMDLSEAFEEPPTEAQLEAEALRRMNNAESWLPSENITVSFVNLADTEEYKNVAALQRVSLCDKVSVYCGPLGVSAVKMQVIRVVYNVLTERYDEIELGKAKTTLAQTITQQIDKVAEFTKGLPTVSMMKSAIDSATSQITGANGGHVRFVYDANGDPQEILIMDTQDISTAVNVWRWNSGGFGHSSNGYAGPYTTAITQDGQIVADFITAGTMLANIIKGGVLQLGGIGNTNGEMIITDAHGSTIGTWNSDGISLLKGDIKGISISLGGPNNGYGRIEMFNSDNQPYGGWDRSGLVIGGTNNASPLLGFNHYSNGERVAYIRLDSYSRATTGEKCQRLSFRIRQGEGDFNEILELDGGSSTESIEPSATFQQSLRVNGALRVMGTKTRVVTTDQYSDRLLYCFETPSPLFGDVGEGKIGDDGKCYVWLDPIFAQTITTTQYQVFLQRYGSGDCWLSERNGNCFVVEGTPGMAFGWEIKAKQKDFDQRRLDRNDELFTVPTQTYGADAAKHIDEIRKEREL